jgi:hypothetical protein
MEKEKMMMKKMKKKKLMKKMKNLMKKMMKMKMLMKEIVLKRNMHSKTLDLQVFVGVVVVVGKHS